MRPFRLLVVSIAVLTALASSSCRAASANVDVPIAWVKSYAPLRDATVLGISGLPDGHVMVLVKEKSTVVLEVDADGEVVASRSVGAPATLIATNAKGEVFLAASRNEDDHSATTRIVKLDRKLNVRWSRNYRVPLAPTLLMATVTAADDGGALLTITSNVSSGIIRIGSQGTVLWSKQYERSGGETVYATIKTRNGDFVFTGESQRRGWIARIAPTGQLRWQKHYGAHEFQSIVEDRNGDLVAVAGEFAVLKVSATGIPRWLKVCADCKEKFMHGRQVVEVRDGYLVTGMVYGPPRRIVLTFRPDGSLLQQIAVGPGQREIGTPPLTQAAEVVVTGHRAIFAPPLQRSGRAGGVLLFGLQDKGVPSCKWFSTRQVALKDAVTPVDAITIEEQSLPVEASENEISTDAHHVSALAETCAEESDARTADWTPAAPEAPRVAFVHDVEKANRAQWRKLLEAREFTKLDAVAAQLLKDGRGDDPMRWRIMHFYRAVAEDGFSESARLPLLRAWASARPTSRFAKLALAWGLQTAASESRGGAYDVTESGAREFQSLMKQSSSILASVKERDDPSWWVMRVAQANALGDGDVAQIGLDAASHVVDGLIFTSVGLFLLPRWGGSPEQYVDFADQLGKRTRASHGDAMYFYLAYRLQFLEINTVVRTFPFDRERLRKGGQDAIRLNPKWITSYHRAAMLAWTLEDRETASTMFKRPELGWYADAEGVWADRTNYDIAREWALGFSNDSRSAAGAAPDPPRRLPQVKRPFLLPQFKGDPSRWPQIVMPVETMVDGKVVRHVAFVGETLSGKSVVSALPYERPLALTNVVAGAAQLNSSLQAAGKTYNVAGARAKVPLPRQMVVRLELAPPSVPAMPALKLRPLTSGSLVPSGMRVLIVGCEFVGSVCRQKTIEGAISSSSLTEGAIRDQMIDTRDPFDIEGFTGAPVLDEDGYVIFVTKRSQHSRGPRGYPAGQTQQTLSAEDLEHVIDKW